MKTLLETDKDFICDIHSPCFQTLTGEEVEMVRSGKTQVIFRRGDILTKQGVFSSYVLFVLKGIAKQYIEDNGTRSLNMRIVKPGEFIGLSSAFSSQIFNYSVQAITECQVFLIEKQAIRSIILQNGKFGLGIISRYCEQNNQMYELLHNIQFKQMNGRLAGVLLYIDSMKELSPEIFQLMTRKDLADFAGISMESAVKLLKSFEKEGIIKLKAKDIEILQKEKLEKIVSIG